MPSVPTQSALHRVGPARSNDRLTCALRLTPLSSTHATSTDGKQNGSLFDFNTDIAVEDLNASLLSYFVLATETRGAAPLRPVFTPLVSTRETGLLPKGAFESSEWLP